MRRRITRGLGLVFSVAAVVAGVLLTPASALGQVSASAYFQPVSPSKFTYSPGAGTSVGDVLVLWSTGAATAYVDLTAPAVRMEFNAKAEQCEGLPRLEVAIDGYTLMARDVAGRGQYGIAGQWDAGRHKVTFRFKNDLLTSSCDRNLKLSFVSFSGPNQNGSPNPIYSSQTFLPQYSTITPSSAGVEVPVPHLWTNGTLAFELDSQNARQLFLQVAATYCHGMPSLRVTVDGEIAHDGVIALPLGNGVDTPIFIDGNWNTKLLHDVTVTMYNDLRTSECDRAVRIKSVTFSGLV